MEGKNIKILEETSGDSVRKFQIIYDEILSKEVITGAEVHYKKSEGLVDKESDPSTWPLQIFTESGITVSVYNVSAGYNGTGPYDMKKILDICGFKNTECVLYSLKDEINLFISHPQY